MPKESYDVPESDNCCEKETYAFAGLAFYWAQVLEKGALNLAVALRFPEVNAINQVLYDSVFDDLNKKTFGQLLNAAKKEININPELELLLKEALNTRNYLIHQFFWDHAENFISEIGKREMNREFIKITKKLIEADKAIEPLYMPIWKKYGIDESFIDNEMEQMRIKANERDKIA